MGEGRVWVRGFGVSGVNPMKSLGLGVERFGASGMWSIWPQIPQREGETERQRDRGRKDGRDPYSGAGEQRETWAMKAGRDPKV